MRGLKIYSAMESSSAFAPAVLQRWWRRENLLAGLALMALAAVGWAYVAYQAASMGSMQSAAMGGMEMGAIGEAALFLLAWTAMMVAMMVPATLPLILLYRTIARNRLDLLRARAGVVIVLLGYIAVWALARLPVYAYNWLALGQGPWRRYGLP